MELPAHAAMLYLIVVVPLCAATVYLDLSRMKIPNWVTDSLLLAFIPLGLIALPFTAFLWQLANPAVMFALALVFHALRLFGGGDSKFLIAASPYVMLGDISFVLMLLAACLLGGFVVHRLIRDSALSRQTEGWISWMDKHRFPMGFSLAPCLVGYLIAAVMS